MNKPLISADMERAAMLAVSELTEAATLIIQTLAGEYSDHEIPATFRGAMDRAAGADALMGPVLQAAIQAHGQKPAALDVRENAA